MKQIKELAKQLLNAVLLGALMIPLILFAISVEAEKPTLSFEGTRIQTAADGSVQLLFDVCLSGNKLKNGTYYAAGTQFTLSFNSDYIAPSDYETNEAIRNFNPSDSAFKVAEELCYEDSGVKKSPFANPENSKLHLVSRNSVSFYLALEDIPYDANNGNFTTIEMGEAGDLRTTFKITGDKLKLGTLSFRVTDVSKVPEIIAEFNGQSNLLFEKNHGKKDSTKKLIYFAKRAEGEGTEPWAILFYTEGQRDERHQTINDYNNDEKAQALFSYDFPKTIIAARAANAELTLNAYQVYTGADLNGDGVLEATVGDISSALQRYSPAITVTYSDGSEGNFIMPWGQATTVNGLHWGATTVFDMNSNTTAAKQLKVVDSVTDTATEIAYDPTAGRYHTETTNADQRYRVSKSFCYTDGEGNAQTFPVPVEVKLTVTPVTLIDLTADKLERSYILNDTLVTSTVTKMSDMELPTMARLTTDVPVGNGTLTMDIPAWGQKQGTSYADGSTLSALHKDGATDATVEHFPVAADIDDGNGWNYTETNSKLRGNNRAGVYKFNMTHLVGGAIEGYRFTKTDIQRKYPWMTVKQDEWDLIATRTVVWNDVASDTTEELVDTSRYLVTYVSTVTENLTTTTATAEQAQPKLTLQVGKDGTSLPDDTKFRVRLPDGTVIGNGVTVNTVTLTDWFTTTVGSGDVNTGYYDTKRGSGTDFGDAWSAPHYAYQIMINSGDVANDEGDYKTEREKLRRYINLGGWFAVSVQESGTADGTTVATTAWSDFIPVYVPPRENRYEESKEYNFLGNTADLFPWQGGVSTTAVLPQGTYKNVDATTGELTGGTLDYGVKTTYNGNTGEQGNAARLYTFTVDPSWKTATATYGGGNNYTQYGADYFLNNALYAAYGRVNNVMNPMNTADYDTADAKTATIRAEKENKTAVTEGLVLEYVATNGGGKSVSETTNADGYTNVQEIVFEAKQQGYTLRQTYTLRLRNTGTTDIDGIALDLLTDVQGNDIYDKKNDSNPAGGHFEILQAPASYLKAGDSTTFVITYVYDLKAYTEGGQKVVADYKDKIFITGNGKTSVGAGKTAGTDYLLDFDAQFTVSPEKLHRVTVNVVPVDSAGKPTMGNAGVIVGETSTGAMNKSAGTTAYAEGNKVYILVEPYDEYEVASITAKDSAGNELSGDSVLQQFNVVKDAEGHFIYYFQMPADDVTVTVAFKEGIYSKLRLSDLRVYSGTVQTNHYPWTGDTTTALPNWNATKASLQKTIWQKTFTEQEQTDAAAMVTEHSGNQEADDLYLMTGQGTATTAGYMNTEPQYVVVLPAADDWAQVEVDLREVLYLFAKADYPEITLPDGTNYENTVLENMEVQMALFDTKPDDMTWAQYVDYIDKLLSGDPSVYTDIYPISSYSWNYDGANYSKSPYAEAGKTNPLTTHTSIPFESPEQGKSKYVRVTVSYKPTGETNSITRSYYIELHRAKAEPEAELNYGNSPFGMIMNDTTMSDKEKERAKTAFVANNFTFDGINSQLTAQNKKDGLTNLVPAVVKGTALEKLHYWIEAWAPPTETWGVAGTAWALDGDWTNANAASGAVSVYDAETGMSETHYKERTNIATENTINLDLNSYAFFAIMGENFTDAGLSWAKDSSGRYVDLSEVVITLEQVDTLTTTTDKDSSANQKQRFTASTPVKVAFVDSTTSAAAKSGATVLMPRTVENEGATLELRAGRYKLTYTYPDYNYIPADPAAGVAESGDHLTVTRDFVVLAPVGDVNSDGTVGDTMDDTVDERLIETRYSVTGSAEPALGYMAYTTDAIFKLRTVDVNNDRNINDADANAISKNATVETFYLPTNYKPTTP